MCYKILRSFFFLQYALWNMPTSPHVSWLLLVTTALCNADSDMGINNPLLLPATQLLNNGEKPHKIADISTAANIEHIRMSVVSESDDSVQGMFKKQQILQLRHKRDEGSGDEGSGVDPSQFLIPEVPILEEYPLNLLIPSTITTLLNSLVSNILTISSRECRNGWRELFNTTDSSGINNGAKALDAFGKVGAGYFAGNYIALGNYDECLSISSTQYCLTELAVENQLTSNPLFFPLLYALCLPRACTEDDIRISANLTDLLQIDSIRCESENKAPYNTGAIIMLIIWCLFAVMVIAATAIHTLVKRLEKNNQSKKGPEKVAEMAKPSEMLAKRRRKKKGSFSSTALGFLLAFSLYESVPKILATKKQPPAAITCLHGIRVISVFWVIMGHTNLWGYFVTSNQISFLKNIVSRVSFRVVTSTEFAVDSFFLLSGLLVTYLTLRQMRRQRGKFKFPAIPYYVHRILRITPVYAFVLFSFWLLTVHFADGPLWQQTIGPGSNFYQSCERYWWTNLLYINNIVPSNHINICMPWTWYLANDMQFFIIAPIIIIPLYFCYPVGLTLLGIMLALNLATIGGIAGTYGIRANVAKFDEVTQALSDEGPEKHNITDDMYTKPWTRIGPYLIGILMGFIFYRQIKPNFRRKYYTHVFYTSLWLLATGLCLTIVYGLHGPITGEDFSESENVAYLMFSRPAWAIGLAIVIFACHNGYGWIVNDFLSMKFWLPLSRLVFTTYLVHGIVLNILGFTRITPVYGYELTTAVFTIATTVLSLSVAAVISTFVEFPLSNVETIIFKLAGVTRDDSTRLSTGKGDKCVVDMNAADSRNENMKRSGKTDDSSESVPMAGDDGYVMKMITKEMEFRLRARSNGESQEGKEEADSIRGSTVAEEGCGINMNTVVEETELKLKGKEAGKADGKAEESACDETIFVQESQAAEEEGKEIIDIEVVMERGCEVVCSGDGGGGIKEEGGSEGSE